MSNKNSLMALSDSFVVNFDHVLCLHAREDRVDVVFSTGHVEHLDTQSWSAVLNSLGTETPKSLVLDDPASLTRYPSETATRRSKCWVVRRNDNGARDEILGFVTRGNTSTVRAWPAAEQPLSGTWLDKGRGHFLTALAVYLTNTLPLLPMYQPNVEQAWKEGLPEDLLKDFQQQIAKARAAGTWPPKA
jgi:hypothetical protein